MNKKITAFNLELDSLTSIEDKYESLYTIIIHNTKIADLINHLFEYLKKIKNMSNNYKKKYLNDRIYGFIELLKEDTTDDNINRIYFVGQDTKVIQLLDISISLLKDYEIDNIFVKYGNQYDISYIKELLFDNSVKDLIEDNKHKYSHYHINNTKGRRLHNELKFDGKTNSITIADYITTLTQGNNKIMFLGDQTNIKKVNPSKYFLLTTKLSNKQIFELYENDTITQNNAKLDIVMSYIDNSNMVDKILFGSDLVTGIKSYLVKTVYCTTKMMEKLHKVFAPEYLNFEIILVKSLIDGDNASTLELNYKGIIGVKYY